MRDSLIAVVVVALVGIAIISYVWETEHRQARMSAAHAHYFLRTLTKAQADYARTYGQYSPSLKALGPTSFGIKPSSATADLVSEFVAAGRPYGYRLEYKAAATDDQGRIKDYTICAYPVLHQWFRAKPPHFSTDQSGVVRFTMEDRCPGPSDPEAGP